jgi:hypothetical protein
MASTPVQKLPPVPPSETIEQRFRRCKSNGGADTQVLSNPGKITGENIAPPTIEGGFVKCDVRAQIQAWLQWGREKGLI